MKLRALDPALVVPLRRSTQVNFCSLRKSRSQTESIRQSKPNAKPNRLINPLLLGPTASSFFAAQYPPTLQIPSTSRAFTATAHAQSWLIPKRGHSQKNRKGRCRVPTGGSTRGTTVVWGDYGIRLRDHDRRISSTQLATGIEAIRKRLRGERYRLFTRVSANIGVYTSGNEVRMGKGKGAFDYWAARVAVSQIIFEVRGELHEQVVRDAMRLAGNKLPGKSFFLSPEVLSYVGRHLGKDRKRLG